MTNLAIECSGTAGSVALFDGETPIRHLDLDTNFSSVRTLACGIEQVLHGQNKPEFISVTNGPGSFTGLRVGLTTAKMLAMAWKVPVVPVDTLQAIALRAHAAFPQSQAPIIAIINAYRGQVFATAVRFGEPGELTVLRASCVFDLEAWQARPIQVLDIAGNISEVLVSGPGLKNYPLANETSDGVAFRTAPPEIWNPTATEVARLGQLGLEAGLALDALTLEPNYIRASAAEEKSKG